MTKILIPAVIAHKAKLETTRIISLVPYPILLLPLKNVFLLHDVTQIHHTLVVEKVATLVLHAHMVREYIKVNADFLQLADVLKYCHKMDGHANHAQTDRFLHLIEGNVYKLLALTQDLSLEILKTVTNVVHANKDGLQTVHGVHASKKEPSVHALRFITHKT